MRRRLLNDASGILVTHAWEAILKLCEQAYVMDKGKFIFSGSSNEAVVNYLDIPVPQPTAARFLLEPSESCTVQTRQDARLSFQVEIMQAEPVDFAFSIEMMRIGVGWEIVLLEDRKPVGDSPGVYTVEIFIPSFPLAPGEYSLNLFLSRRKLTPQDTGVSYDLRTWTTGNGLRLSVEGEHSDTLVKLPFAVSNIKEGD